MIVVDTNILIHALVASPRTEAVRRLWSKDAAWRLPGLWRWEFTNVVWLKVKTGGMEKVEALRLMNAAARKYDPLERPVFMEDAFRAALQFSISGYDGAFVALAQMLGTKLVTEDKKLRKAVGDLGCTVEELLSQES